MRLLDEAIENWGLAKTEFYASSDWADCDSRKEEFKALVIEATMQSESLLIVLRVGDNISFYPITTKNHTQYKKFVDLHTKARASFEPFYLNELRDLIEHYKMMPLLAFPVKASYLLYFNFGS